MSAIDSILACSNAECVREGKAMDVGCIKIRGLYEQMEILDLNITVGKNKHVTNIIITYPYVCN